MDSTQYTVYWDTERTDRILITNSVSVEAICKDQQKKLILYCFEGTEIERITSGEHRRNIGRPKFNQFINELIR